MTIDGKEAKVTFHTFPLDSSANHTKRRQWFMLFGVMLVNTLSTLSLVNGRRSACFTSDQQIFTTTGVEVLEQGLSEATEEICQLKEVLQKVKGENEKLKGHLEQMTAENEKLQQHLKYLNAESGKLVKRLDLVTNEASHQKKLAEMRTFCFENIQDSDEDVLFYTGLPSASVFYHLFQYLNRHCSEAD